MHLDPAGVDLLDGRRTDARARGSETGLLLAFHHGPADDELELGEHLAGHPEVEFVRIGGPGSVDVARQGNDLRRACTSSRP